MSENEKTSKSPAVQPPSFDDKAPKAIAETFDQVTGVAKATMNLSSVIVLGILAGAYIGFGGMLSSTVTFDAAAIVGTGISKLLGGAVFSCGLIMVVIAGAELFTGNNLMVSSAMTGKISWATLIKRWIVVYLANFAGSLLIMALFYYSGLWKTGDYGLGATAMKVANTKVSLSFAEVLWRGIGCNWLVCVAVWMAASARQTVGKIFAIFFPIMAFVTLGFEHCVANMYFIPTGILFSGVPEIAAAANINLAGLTWGNFLVKNLLPATIGNIIGGVVFVGMSYWFAYVRPEKK
jgi:formate/nitrite transporter